MERENRFLICYNCGEELQCRDCNYKAEHEHYSSIRSVPDVEGLRNHIMHLRADAGKSIHSDSDEYVRGRINAFDMALEEIDAHFNR